MKWWTTEHRFRPARLIRWIALVAVVAAVPLGVTSALATSIVTDVFVYQNGDTVTVTGDGFGAAEQVDVVTTDPNGTAVDAGVADTDAAGAFTYSFVLPVTVSGLYTIVATGRT